MRKKLIKYPEALQMTLDGKPLVYGLDNYIEHLLNTCDEFNKSSKGIRAGARIEIAIRENAGKDSKDLQLVLDEDDADLLASVCEDPTNGYPWSPARNLIRFMDALKSAKLEEYVQGGSDDKQA